MNSAPGQQRQAETGPWAVKPARGRERNTIRRHLQWDLSIYTLGSLHKREADLETSKTTYDHTQKKKEEEEEDRLRLASSHTQQSIRKDTPRGTESLPNTLFRARLDMHLCISESSSWTPKTLCHKSMLFQI